MLVACGSEEKKDEKHLLQKTPYDKGVLASMYNDSLKPFYFGVASGDPTSTSVIIWTKLTPEYLSYFYVKYEVATDADFKYVVKEGRIGTDRRNDFIVKADISGLKPDTYYFYRFYSHGKWSITGRTHTFPTTERDVNLIFTSCSNYSWGYFTAYDAMSKDTVDAIVHLGDYIYEHEPGTYGSKQITRTHIPGHELISLHDYRTRYAQYRLEPELMRAHQMHPFITVWDDHELANNAYVEGAQNHQTDKEGEWFVRQRAAVQAYYEWLPVREFIPAHLYRSFEIGPLVKLVMIDNRVAGRTVQVKSSKDSLYNDTSRSILGKEQFDWSLKELKSGETWKIIGNPVLFGELKLPGWGNNDLYMDGWDGYPAEKHAWVDSLEKMKLNNLVFMTGDFHSSLVLQAGYKNKKRWFEFVVPSISSGNYDEDHPMNYVLAEEKKYKALNSNLSFVNLHDHGYIKARFSKNQVKVNFIYVSTVTDKNYSLVKAPYFIVSAR